MIYKDQCFLTRGTQNIISFWKYSQRLKERSVLCVESLGLQGDPISQS